MLGSFALGLVAWLAPASRCADVTFTPAPDLQIVAWVETAAGDYVDTIYITQTTGRYGLGNRPGRFDFNSGPMWPYGRRTTTFPVWAHRHGLTFPMVIFQNSPEDPDECDAVVNDPDAPPSQQRAFTNCGENNLSHPFDQSSRETFYCKPMIEADSEWQQAEAMTCATVAYTDKGRLSATKHTGYPPRADLTEQLQGDLPSVTLYRMMNPFDAISQATPAGGVAAELAWPVPATLADGAYVLWLEVAKERDHNATYSVEAYPPLAGSGPRGISWSGYGVPYRGQPSVLYRVPFTIGRESTSATTASYAGYGSPDGSDGDVRPPDATITTDTPGSGASRLQLVSDVGELFRVRIRVQPNLGFAEPGIPEQLAPKTIATNRVTLGFIAPGVGSERVAGYDVRVSANVPITEDTFDTAMPITTTVSPADPGSYQELDVLGLLPETDYWFAIRAYDRCKNPGELAIVQVTTADRVMGEVDACFVATAAYGSAMANDVELLRHTRDALLRETVLGELAVETYYTFGPALAGVVGESDVLRASARAVLAPLVARVRRLAY